MLRITTSCICPGSLLVALAIAPAPALAQYDLDTCSGRLSYCVEWARRSGASTAGCEASYQACQRTGVAQPRRDLNNPYVGAAPGPTLNNPYPGAIDRRDPNNPYV